MTTDFSELTTEELLAGQIQQQRQSLLEAARKLDRMGKQFERFMALQLQKLEITIDEFEREKEAWRRQRDRELDQLEYSNAPQGRRDHHVRSSNQIDQYKSEIADKRELPRSSEHSTGPLLILIDPGSASAMQLGLLLFEISKLSREYGGGGARFEVNAVRIARSSRKRKTSGPIIAMEAFSYLPLLSYDGSVTRQLEAWEAFKSKLILSTLTDKDLPKEFKKGVLAPRDHESTELATESTRRAENANTKCDNIDNHVLNGLYLKKQSERPTQQQLQRIEEVYSYLSKEYGVRLSLSLIW